MNALRTALGIALLAGGGYVLVGEHLAGTSADATVNARLYVARAPIEGRVSLAVRAIGAKVRQGELIADIADQRFDNSRLLDLERSRDGLQVELKRVGAQRTALKAARGGFEAQLADYQRGRIGQLEARIAESQSGQDAVIARLREAESALKRANELSDKGVQTAAALDRARAAYDVVQQESESARQRVNYHRTELVSARAGVFIGDSYNDAPFSAQRIRDIDLKLTDLEVEAEQIALRAAQFDRQIGAERVRLNQLTSATLTTGVEGVAWDFLIDDGEYARRGQDLVKLVDCKSLIVTSSVTEALYDKLTIGMPVQFRLFGDARLFDGTVIRLGGSGASSLFANLAVGPSAKHLERFHVSVSVPDLANHPDLTCAIGRTGRVVFTHGPLANLRRLLTRYGF